MTADALSEMISAAEFAEYARLNIKTVYKMIREGQLPGARNMCGTIRIHKPTVLAWLASGDVAMKQRKRSI